jgi:hypothetical protein
MPDLKILQQNHIFPRNQFSYWIWSVAGDVIEYEDTGKEPGNLEGLVLLSKAVCEAVDGLDNSEYR